jgi:hypothetical protein
MTEIYNMLIDNPARVSEVPILYEFRSVFIPKKNGDYRPLAIIESLLMPLHQYIKDKLMGWCLQTGALGTNQFAFRKNAQEYALYNAAKM